MYNIIWQKKVAKPLKMAKYSVRDTIVMKCSVRDTILIKYSVRDTIVVKCQRHYGKEISNNVIKLLARMRNCN